ncbi:iron-sulfur cluster carrier protein ApbC [Rhodobium gokarnense]|uniref:Iron-sulfur cluster carrier protein n=1 Tax=Rhodobium gokarnense TaxID=364296 RepID=A0ABT3HGJ6_9HYPH|nr:iron-sulfur cluster carrier protein ApbC [Rhodobium gokarnense]MCW2309500.1 ATP-binding protein involved in chromosome partitioning [Rhodobium gokarnense]
MSEVTKEVILERLQKVRGPDGNSDLVELGLVSDIFVSGGRVAFSITVDADKANDLEPMRKAAEEVVSRIPGVESVMVALTAERKPGSGGAAPQQARPAAPGSDPAKPGVDGVKTIIAVASGKGGVGKSTTAINLALGLQANGLKVGVLDADIYGPSLPRLLKIERMPEPPAEGKLKAFEGYGLKVMSMGFLVEEDTPMIWRGPMVMSALTQMLREVDWGELDVMVVDMPPGTGDAQLTMAQQVPLAGAVIVSTPQDLALIDARKGLAMFKKVSVPVLGIIENMSYFLCPSCGTRSDIFGHGGARAEAEKLGAPFLGEVPLHMEIRETSDAGTPVVVSAPDGPHARIFKDIAAKVWEQVTTREGRQRAAPKIVMD